MSSSPFVFHIADLRRERAEPRRVSIEASVTWSLELSRVLPYPPLESDLDLIPTSGGVLVRGTVAITARHSCHRCLEEWDEDATIEVAQLFVDPDVASEDDYELPGDELDVEPMLRDEVLLAMPLVPTCPDECEGLVEPAQSDLNSGAPDEAGDSGSPFAVLKDLFEPGTQS